MSDRWLAPMKLGEIGEAARNPKAHDGQAIGRSIGRFGYVEAMVLDERTSTLVAGHGRLADLKGRRDRGETPPDGVEAHGTDWLVPVLRGWSSRSDDEAVAAGVALNRVGEVGGWQRDVLSEILADLPPDLLVDTGFSGDDVESMLAQFAEPPNLDDLEAEYGPPAEGDGWTTVTITAPPHVVAGWVRWMRGYDTPGAAFAGLLEEARVVADPLADLVDAGAAPPPPEDV